MNYVLVLLSLKSPKPKTMYKSVIPKGRHVVRHEEWSMSSFIREPLPQPCPAALGVGGGAASSGPWPGLPLEGSQGASFCHTKVKCQWQLPSASPELKPPLFERLVFHLERGARKSHVVGEEQPRQG